MKMLIEDRRGRVGEGVLGTRDRESEIRKGRSVEVRLGTLNVRTMTIKGRVLANIMERRKVDCVFKRPSGKEAKPGG